MASAAPAPGFALLLSADRTTRLQLVGLLISAATYVVYVAIVAMLVALSIVDAGAGAALAASMLVANAGFYAWVRSGRAHGGRDPGLRATQMVVGIVFMYAGYLISGPAAPGLTIIMASHVVYAMFWLPPRRVAQLVAGSLAGLAATMVACATLWPARYPVGIQVATFLFAALVMPTIGLLARRITTMTERLKAQRGELEAALARLQLLATRDELTRTHNRAHMTELVAHQHDEHRRKGEPLALALLDIDHFKRVNDGHGHAAGDEVLRRFAGLTLAHLREQDLLARWGGEEFLLLLPQSTRDEALGVLDRLQQLLHHADPAEMPHRQRVSFSAGITELRPDEAVDHAIERADRAMYRAKEAGRARCVAA